MPLCCRVWIQQRAPSCPSPRQHHCCCSSQEHGDAAEAPHGVCRCQQRPAVLLRTKDHLRVICDHRQKGNSVTKTVKIILGERRAPWQGVKKLAYFAGKLSGHCKIYRVTLEAQVVQAVRCSSQNLQNQTDSRYKNRLLQCKQTGHRACSQAMQEGLLQSGVSPSAGCARSQSSNLVLD